MALRGTRPVPPLKDALLPHGRFLVEQAMRAQGLSVTGLALRLGISRKHISNVLGGKVPLGEDLARALAAGARPRSHPPAILRHDGIVPPPLGR